jgi:hypothetical protein
MASPYIILQNSDASLVKRYRVIQGGYLEQRHKAQSRNEGIEGGVDIGMGEIYVFWRFLLRVYFSDPDGSNYGDLDDLKTFYNYNNPNGTPTNLLTLTDHYNTTHGVYFMGNLDFTPLTVIIDGNNSQWHIPIELHET